MSYVFNYHDLGLKHQSIKIIRLRTKMTEVARANIPVDTGNMQNNAVYTIAKSDGFSLVFDQRFAYYLPIVNEGIYPLFPESIKVQANKGCVDRAMNSALGVINEYAIYDGNIIGDRKYNTRKKTMPLFVNLNKMVKDLKYDEINEENITTMGIGGTRMLYRFRKSLGYVDLGYEDEVQPIYSNDKKEVYER